MNRRKLIFTALLVLLSATTMVAWWSLRDPGLWYWAFLALLILTAVSFSHAILSRRIARLLHQQEEIFRQLQAMAWLSHQVPLRAPLPFLGGWALRPQGAAELARLVREHRPRRVVDLGSGSSTVLLAALLRERPDASVVSFDSDPEFCAATIRELRIQGLEERAEVRCAPLRPVTLNDRTWSWYDIETMADLEAIDLLVIDGPPSNAGPLARFPALPVLYDRLSPDAAVMLDDAERPDERQIVERWLRSFPDLRRVGPGTPPGIAVLRRTDD